MKLIKKLNWIILLLIVGGCASINNERKPVTFSDSNAFFRYKKIKPDDFENDGLKLRLYQQNRVLHYIDQLDIFTQIVGKEGIPIKVKKKRKIIFAPGTSLDNFYITTETISEDLSIKSNDKLLMSNRGEILKFVTGEYISDKGKIEIIVWSRTPIFPEQKVNVGDKWSYVEEVKAKLNSFWISRDIEGPEKIIINCKLTGFAEVKGRRCAIIETYALNTKSESYTAMFKTMKLKIKTHLKEKIFFDYKRGLEMARIIKTNSFTTSEDNNFSDISQSQTVSILDER